MTDHAGEFLKCDTPTCDHFEMAPIIVENIGKACPKCGASLLTSEDFITFSAIRGAADAANKIALAADPSTPMVLVATNVHGSTFKAKIVENAEQNPFPNVESDSSPVPRPSRGAL